MSWIPDSCRRGWNSQSVPWVTNPIFTFPDLWTNRISATGQTKISSKSITSYIVKATVWFAILTFGIISPSVFQNDSEIAQQSALSTCFRLLRTIVYLVSNQTKENAWFQWNGATARVARLAKNAVHDLFPKHVLFRWGGGFFVQRSRLIWRFLAFSWETLKSKVHIHHPQNISDLKLGRNSHSSKHMLHLTMGSMDCRLETFLLKGGDHLKTCSRSGKHCCILQDNILIIL